MAKWTEKSKLVDAILDLIDSGANTHSLLSTNSSIEQLSSQVNLVDILTEINPTLSYMKSSGLITGKQNYRLTNKARKRILQRQINTFSNYVPVVWDEKWRIVMFEIPEPMKTQRDALTTKLKKLGFVHLQRSVFIYPFDLLDSVLKIAQYYDVSMYVSVLTTDTLSIPTSKMTELLTHFKLEVD